MTRHTVEELLTDHARRLDHAATAVDIDEVLGRGFDGLGRPRRPGRFGARVTPGLVAAGLVVVMAATAVMVTGVLVADESNPVPVAVEPIGSPAAVELPEDLRLVGRAVEPVEGLPYAAFSSGDAWLTMRVGDLVSANPDVDLPLSVDDALDAPLRSGEVVSVRWALPDGRTVEVVASTVSTADLSALSRSIDDTLQTSGSLLEIDVPDGWTRTPLVGRKETTVQWLSPEGSRGVQIRSLDAFPGIEMPTPTDGSTGDFLQPHVDVRSADGRVLTIATFGLGDDERRRVVDGAADIDLNAGEPAALATPTPPATGERRTFVTAADGSWHVVGEVVGDGGDRMLAVSGLAEVRDEWSARLTDPFGLLGLVQVLPVGTTSVLTVNAWQGASDIEVIWTTSEGSDLGQILIGGHLPEMTAAGYPPVAAASVPAEAATATVTLLDGSGRPLAPPAVVDVTQPVNPPG